MRRADMRRADMRRADVRRIDMRRIDVRRADMRRAGVRRIDVRDGSFTVRGISFIVIPGYDPGSLSMRLGMGNGEWGMGAGGFLRHLCRQQATGDGERVTALIGACRRHYVVIAASWRHKTIAARRHLKRINASTH